MTDVVARRGPVAGRRAPGIDPGEQRFLFGLCYRLTGSAADAEDLVQETMLRAIERPPPRTEAMRPWLVRVAMNLGRDLLRKRKRRGYVGPWLPSPVEDELLEIPVEARGAEGRYDLVESVSFAFLVALEALTPLQRAVVLLCDVFDYPVKEAAEALGISESNVKVTHHCARRALAAYDAARVPRTTSAQTQEALQRFLTSIATEDGAALEALLAEEARALNDGGGEFFAARRPIRGKDRVARFYLGLRRKFQAKDARYSLRWFNGSPAIVVEQSSGGPKLAPVSVTSLTLDAAGRIACVYTFLATPKLTHVGRRR